MAVAATEGRQQVSTPTRHAPVTLFAWCVLGVGLFAALTFYVDPTRLSISLGDTDDATRLVEVRRLMDGASWFDMTLPRFGAEHPLHSHWSRLIDLPIAGLLSAFELVMPASKAELAVRAVWPLTLLLAFVFLLARETEIRGGRRAALLSIALSLTCITGIVQFLPGRIDHHNAVILCAVIGILQLARSFDDPRAGWSAGIFLGLAIAIGYEALALIGASLDAAVLYGLLPRRSLLGASRAAVTFAATLTTVMAATTAPGNFFAMHCDALSMNLVLIATAGAIGVCAVQALEGRLSPVAKLALLAVSGGIGLALYGLVEPACLSGPFGQIDPALFRIWLGSVSEAQSIFSLGAQLPLLGGVALVYFATGLYSGAKLLGTDPSETLRFDIIALLVAIALSCWQIKLLPYATYLTVPLLAVWLARPPGTAQKPVSGRALAALAGATLALVAAAAWLLTSASAPSESRVKQVLDGVQSCLTTAALAPLAHLPAGLAVADVNLGPYLVALTRLDALSAPYHRLDASIIEGHEILHATPAEAERRLHDIGASYVISCKGLDSTTLQRPDPPDALQALLFAGTPPAFLAPVPLAETTPLKVWRVKP